MNTDFMRDPGAWRAAWSELANARTGLNGLLEPGLTPVLAPTGVEAGETGAKSLGGRVSRRGFVFSILLEPGLTGMNNMVVLGCTLLYDAYRLALAAKGTVGENKGGFSGAPRGARREAGGGSGGGGGWGPPCAPATLRGPAGAKMGARWAGGSTRSRRRDGGGKAAILHVRDTPTGQGPALGAGAITRRHRLLVRRMHVGVCSLPWHHSARRVGQMRSKARAKAAHKFPAGACFGRAPQAVRSTVSDP